MTPAQEFVAFLLRVLVAALLASFLIVRFAKDAFPELFVRFSMPICFVVFFVLGSIEQLFVYHYVRSPLRHLPTIKSKTFGNIISESPRGKTALTWMKKYPDAEMIRVLGPMNVPIVILSGANSLRDVLNTHPYDFIKFEGIASFLARVIGFGLILVEGNEHKLQRKALTPSFNIRNIRGLYGLMWEKTGILIDELQKDIVAHPAAADSKYGKVEISEWSSRLTLDIIGPTAMGKDFQALTNEDNAIAAAYLEILNPTKERLAFLGLHFVVPEWMVRRLPWSVNRMINKECGFLRNLCHKIVLEKKHEIYSKGVSNDYDILSSIIQTGQFSDDKVVDQMMTFLAAGHETTASALAWTCYLCAKHPEVQDKLRAEIRERIPSHDSPVTYDLMESMPYLNGVCEETQRLYPTVPATIREPIKPTTVAGVHMPKGTRLVLIPHAVNRHPKFWGETGADFIPERWIDKLADGTTRPNKHGGASTNFAEITFLHGPRSCIGRDFAKAELRCAVAGIIGKFHIELQNPNVEPTVMGVITTKPKGGMHLLMKSLDGW